MELPFSLTRRPHRTLTVQQPGGLGGASGGQREFASALAVGCAAVFTECHYNPDRAPSDGPVMLPLAWVERVVRE